jgi:ADP-ribose pyrophosphatase YjhB (NUDIX family)
VSVGLLRRGGELLLMAVRDDSGALKGWRPLGGTIEFGERAATALARELREEIGETISEPRLLTVLENLYDHHGSPGHEIVFVFEAAFVDDQAYQRPSFAFVDQGVRNDVEWVDLARLKSGREKLFPDGLLQALADRY